MLKKRLIKAGVAFFLFAVWNASQASIIYNVSRTVGSATVTGTLTTDGAIGSIGAANILAWDFVLDDGMYSSTLNTANSYLYHNSMHTFEATLSELTFDYGAENSSLDFFLFYENNQVGFWCLEGPTNGCAGTISGDEIGINNAGSRIHHVTGATLGEEVIGRASNVSAPATLALMGLGIAGIGYQRRRKAA